MPTFGNTHAGSNSQTYGWWRKGASQFTAPENGTLTKITAYHRHDNDGQKVTAVVYADSGSDSPDALLGYVTRDDIPGDGVWRWSEFDGFNIPITAGTKYWLGIHHDATYGGVRYDAETCNNRLDTASDDYHPPDDPFGSGTDSDSIKLSIYATYTTGGVTYTKTWQTDVLFKKLGITRTFGVDSDFKKPDITKSLAADAAFQKQGIPETFGLDAAFQKSFILQKQVDALFKRFDVLKSFALDARFGALMTQTISKQIDALLKRLDATKAFGLDIYFGSAEAETYAKTFGVSVIFAYRVRLPELWLDENGKIVLNVSKPYTWVGT
jgi:hypothetical protein